MMLRRVSERGQISSGPDGFWQRELSHFPKPISPMTLTAYLPSQNAALRGVFSEFSLLADTIDFREINGWVYQRVVPLGGRERRPPPAWLMPLLVRVVPQLRSRIRGCVQAIRSDKPGRAIDGWFKDLKPALLSRQAKLRAADLETLTDAELDAQLTGAQELLAQGLAIHFLLHGALCMVLAELAFACRDLLGWGDRQCFELLSGLSAQSTEPAQRLSELAQMAREQPALQRLIESAGEQTVDQILAADAGFASAFSAYLADFGCRALRYELADPTLAESPDLVVSLIRDQLRRGYDPAADAESLRRRREAARAEARARLAQRSAAERARFERALERAERGYPVREENEFYTVSLPLALLRLALLKAGRRLSARGIIAQSDDIFWLEFEEARDAVRAGGDRLALVARRRAERARAEAQPGPARYGIDPGPPPSTAALPAEARFAMDAFLWYFLRIVAPEESNRAQPAAAELRGVAASPGRYTGPARVIMGEDEFDKIEPGDILVCPVTSPVWSVLFPSIGALVTDTGGILSHPAIIAREYRIPAVVATGNATRLLRDGQIVTVDGDTGAIQTQ